MKLHILITLAGAAQWLPPSLAAQTPQLDSIGRYITLEMKRQQIPGLSVAILRGDRILLARGYGFANLELRAPASDRTGKARQRVVTVYYASDWRATYFDYESH
ncbi:MAG TPA: hypothetical protein VGP44_09890 [Gemmatimonadales bacterium]|nr:hypothetical protein [Gemmatimonadales bacterium]